MDPEAFLDLANQVAKIKMYPYFDLAHAAVCCLAIKEDMASGRTNLKKSSPNKSISRNFFDQILLFAISKMAKNQFMNWEKV